MDMFDRVIAREGGAKITNDPVDPGGVTKYGISKRAHPTVDVPNLTYDQAKNIYVEHYFNAHHLYLLPPELQEMALDFSVHSGGETAIRYLQKIVGVEKDGKLGPATLKAIDLLKVEDVKRAYMAERVLFLARQVVSKPTKLKYLIGWLTRALTVAG